MARPLHVVQLGYDDTVFGADAPSDTRHRQALYAGLLDAERPGSRLTLLVLTPRVGLAPIREGPLRCLPVAGPAALRLPRLLAQLRRLNGDRRIDVLAPQTVLADGWAALAFGAWAGIPVVGQVHFDLFGAPGGAPAHDVPRWRMWVARRLFRRFAAVRVVSRHLATEIARRGLHDRVSVVAVPATMPSAPGAGSAPGASGAEQAGSSAGGPRVLFVGRLVAQKNLSRWLRVAARVAEAEPDVGFVWAGDGPLGPALRAEAERLGLAPRLDARGAVAHGDLPALYRSAAVFLLTSDYEGLPRVAVEAGLHGLPVVAPTLPGLDDVVVSGETGVLCPPGDEGALAAAVIRLLRDAPLRASLGARARERVQREFDARTLAARWIDLLITVGGGGR